MAVDFGTGEVGGLIQTLGSVANSMDVDVFHLWRWLLSIVCTVYVTVCTVRSVWRWLDFFGASREGMVMGHYASLLLLRIRMRRFAREFLLIAGLAGVLGGIVYLHWVLV